MKGKNGLSAAEPAGRGNTEECNHPEEERVWDSETGEEVCGRCGEVISVEPVMVPRVRYDAKRQGYLSLTELNTGTLPPEGTGRREISMSNKVATICSRLALPKPVLNNAVSHALKILRAARRSPRRVTMDEAAAAGIICACRESGHPLIMKRLQTVLGMTQNEAYRLLARISRFYPVPSRVTPAERYIRAISGRFEGRVEPRYLSLVEHYACRVLKAAGRVHAAPIHRAAAALSVADGLLGGRMGWRRIVDEAGLSVNGGFSRLARRLKNSHVPPPVEAMDYAVQAFWEG